MVKGDIVGTQCPKCKGKFTKHFASISGNSKYITWQCEKCGYNEMKCMGLVNQ